MPKSDSILPPGDWDWERFPPSVKRKYFSSLERLRLAQAASKTSSSRNNYAPLKSPTFPPTDSKPTLLRRNSSYFRSNSFLRSRKIPSPTSDTFSHSDAQFFLRLPDKVQQKHFTREERLLLSGQSETFIPDAADERVIRSFFQQGREANRSVPTLSASSSSSVETKSTFEPELLLDDSEEEMDDSAFDGFRWIENDDDHDLASTLHLDDYHEFMNEAADSNPKPHKRQPSFRRALSLTSLPFGTNHSSIQKPCKTSPTTPAPASPVPKLITSQKRKASLSQLKPSQHTRKPSISTDNPLPDPPAIHYTDPSARLKLRVYLASPQKFDEAIEFGFPSMEDKETMSLSRPSLTRSHPTAPAACRTFLDDDPSVFDALDDASSTAGSDDDDDEDAYAHSLPDRSSPYTPLDTTFPETYLLSPSEAPSSLPGGLGTGYRSTRTSHSASGNNNNNNNHNNSNTTLFFPRPTVRHNYEYDDPYMQALSGTGREMTLRMTLTRPDLRADEKDLYPQNAYYTNTHSSANAFVGKPQTHGKGEQGNGEGDEDDDPLALEHLPLSKEGDQIATDIWESSGVGKEKGVFRRVWRKVSGRGG